MSDIPTAQQRADIVDRLYGAAGRPAPGKAVAYAPISLLVFAAQEIERLRAGLLADPATSRTDDEQAVIEAAIALAADWATYPSGCPDWNTETLALIAAVDRLTATEETT